MYLSHLIARSDRKDTRQQITDNNLAQFICRCAMQMQNMSVYH